MEYEVIGGPLSGKTLDWREAKSVKRCKLYDVAGKLGRYRAPTLGESVAWGWPAVIVWDA